jgi:RNA-splicing ligase RtcB
MPDACPAGPVGTIPVGGVVVARNSIIPGMHSADICCSLMLTNIGKIDPKLVLDLAESVTHFGPGGRGVNNKFILSDDIMHEIKLNSFLNSEKSIMLSKSHLGTQGASNHFLYVGTSKKTGDTVIVTHHGSRGFGALLYKNGMIVAEKFRKKISPKTIKTNAWIPYDTDEGREYWNALQIVRKWTKQNHSCIHDEICKLIGVEIKDRFWNEHNFVFKVDDLFYHAKGATPMDIKFIESGPKIIPLNMSQPILIVEKNKTTKNSLGFAPHGAGRNMSRSKHKSIKTKDKSIEELLIEETKDIDARFYCGEIDISELPSAYKNAEQVKESINEFNLADIVDEIIPFGCIMSGDVEKNAPWRNKNK